MINYFMNFKMIRDYLVCLTRMWQELSSYWDVLSNNLVICNFFAIIDFLVTQLLIIHFYILLIALLSSMFQSRSLFVKNLNFKTSDENLRKHFSEHMKEGSIISVRVNYLDPLNVTNDVHCFFTVSYYISVLSMCRLRST